MRMNYEKLDVLIHGRLLVKDIYELTGKWPNVELFSGGLGNQVRRSAVSVVLNIAEGSAGTKADFARFVRISTKSALETREALILAEQLNYFTNKDLITRLETLYFKLQSLRKSLS